MTPIEIIDRLHGAGLSLRLKDAGMVLVGKGAPAELVALVRAHKPALMIHLNASKPDKKSHQWNKGVGDLELLYPDGKVTRAIDDEQPTGKPTHFRTSRKEGWVAIPDVFELHGGNQCA